MKLRNYQQQAVDEVFAAFQEYSSSLVVLPTGCHAIGTPILLMDGTIKPVEKVQVGDRLVGPDGNPRQVLQLARGKGEMYRIIPVKGEPFVVNEDHILTLIRTNDRTGKGGEIIDVSVRDWLGWAKSRKHLYKLFRAPVPEFQSGLRGQLEIPPYILGVLLGDGGLKFCLCVTTADPEIVSEIRKYAKSVGNTLGIEPAGGKSKTYIFKSRGYVGCKGSMLHQTLTYLGLRGAGSETKYIPWEFKVASIKDRLELLAGLMDTDGHYTTGGYDFISKSKKLAEDVVFLSRSVGLAAYVKPCRKSSQNGTEGTYYRVSISGNCEQIPCRIARKKCKSRRQKKDVLRTGFRVEHVGENDYYGFSLDGDGRFLMGDFTVTHNTGKTVAFASVVAEHRRIRPGRAMVVAHREELIFQAAEKIKQIAGVGVDIEMAEMRASAGMFGKAPVVVSSVQSQIAGCDGEGRMSRFNPDEFSLLVIDEAHHATAPSYRKVIDYYRQNPDLRVLGVTATPDRQDEAALGQIFESVAFDYELPDAIHDGWLVPVKQRSVIVDGLDFSNVKTTAGDLNGADLAKVMEYEQNLHEIASPTIDLAGDRKTLIFAASIAHAERLCEIFNRHKNKCARFVCGGTPKEDRRQMFADYEAGSFQYLCNVGVATEGFDEPGIQLVVMARPTKSRALYAQMAGRGTRPLNEIAHKLGELAEAEFRRAMIAASDKPHCEIVDFVGNAGRHKLITTADILGGNYTDEVVERARKKAESASGPVDMSEALDLAEHEIAEEHAAARRKALTAKVNYKVNTINPFDVLDIEPHRERGWDKGRQPSEKMLALLHKAGVPTRDLNFTKAKQLIGEIINRRDQKKCTYKQAKILTKYGYRTDVDFHEAKGLIDSVAANGWRRPADSPQTQERKIVVY